MTTAPNLIPIVFHGHKKRLVAYVSTIDTTWQETGLLKLWNRDGKKYKRKLPPWQRKLLTCKPPRWHVEIPPSVIVEFGAPFLRKGWRTRYREAREKLTPEEIAALWP